MEQPGRGGVVVRVLPHQTAEPFAVAARLLSAGRSVVVALDPHVRADVTTVGALARLALTARRSGAVLQVWADPGLQELVDLMGLRDALGPAPDGRSAEPQR